MANTKNRSQMITLILRRLGAVGQGQTESADDVDLVGTLLDGAMAELRARNAIDFSVSAVPDWAWAAMRDYVAADLVGDFGVSGERLQEIMMGRDNAEARLARVTEGDSGVVEVEFM